jgi:hypothetical protein
VSRSGLLLFSLLSLLWQGLSQSGARAQQSAAQDNESQIERSRLPNPLTPVTGGLSVGEPDEGTGSSETAPAAPGDNDLGILSVLHQAERRQPWTLFADGGFVYTSNVALTNRNTHDDVFFVGEGGVGYEWKLAPDLTLAGTAEEQYFAYDKFNELDFGSMNFALALSYTAHKLSDIVLSVQLGFTRLTHSSVVANEFFRNGGLSLGAQKLFSIGRAQLVGIGGDIDLGYSVPHVAEREDFGLSTNYIVQFTRHLSLQTGVLAAYYLYPDTGREDFNLSGTGGASYAFTPWCTLGVTLSGTLDRSTREPLAYNLFNAGGTLLFRMHF